MISRRKGAAAGLMAGVLAVMPVMGSRAMAAPVINSGEADAQSSHMAGPGQEETVRRPGHGCWWQWRGRGEAAVRYRSMNGRRKGALPGALRWPRQDIWDIMV